MPNDFKNRPYGGNDPCVRGCTQPEGIGYMRQITMFDRKYPKNAAFLLNPKDKVVALSCQYSCLFKRVHPFTMAFVGKLKV